MVCTEEAKVAGSTFSKVCRQVFLAHVCTEKAGVVFVQVLAAKFWLVG